MGLLLLSKPGPSYVPSLISLFHAGGVSAAIPVVPLPTFPATRVSGSTARTDRVLPRSEIAKFMTTHEGIKAFEKIQERVGGLGDDTTTILESIQNVGVDASSAGVRAELALDLLASVEQRLELIEFLAPGITGDALARILHSLDFVLLGPPRIAP